MFVSTTYASLDAIKLNKQLALLQSNKKLPPKTITLIKETQTMSTKLSESIEQCKKDKDDAENHCFEGNNKSWNEFSNMMGSMGDMASMSMSGSCSKLGDLLKMGQAAQLGFRGQCAWYKDSCEKSCNEAVQLNRKIGINLNTISNNIETTLSEQQRLADEKVDRIIEAKNKAVSNAKPNGDGPVEDQEALIEAEEKNRNDLLKKYYAEAGISNLSDLQSQIDSVREDLASGPNSNLEDPKVLMKACSDKQQVIAKTGMNIMSLMNSVQQNQACADELKSFEGMDLTKCPFNQADCPALAGDNCSDPANKESVYCKTVAASNAGLARGTPKAGTFPDPKFGDGNTNSLSNLDMKGLGSVGGSDSTGAFDPNAVAGDASGSRSAGVPGGHGGTGLSIPGGGYNPKGGSGGRGIGSVDSGPIGSGSGYGTAPIGSNNSASTSRDAYEKFLPGGEKDPDAKKGFGPEGITNSKGLTLFEKVTRTFKNNKTSFIPE